jgi:hypothetical protein
MAATTTQGPRGMMTRLHFDPRAIEMVSRLWGKVVGLLKRLDDFVDRSARTTSTACSMSGSASSGGGRAMSAELLKRACELALARGHEFVVSFETDINRYVARTYHEQQRTFWGDGDTADEALLAFIAEIDPDAPGE